MKRKQVLILTVLFTFCTLGARDKWRGEATKAKRSSIAQALKDSPEPNWKDRAGSGRAGVDVVDEIADVKREPERRRGHDTDLCAVGSERRDESVDTVPKAEKEVDAVVPQEDAADEERQQAREAVEELLKRGIDYFDRHSVAATCSAFSHTKDFVKGELYLFVYTQDGVCLAHGEQSDLLWKNLSEHRDSFGTFPVREIVQKAKDGGGWLSYEWRGVTKVSYVRPVIKDDVMYVVGSGYYPYAKDDAAVSLVKGAVSTLNRLMREERPLEDGFSEMSYPIGPFVDGDLYLFALDSQGTILAHAHRPRLVGLNAWNEKDERGVYLNQEIFELLHKARGKGIWIEYQSHKQPKRVYAEEVRDKQGKSYFVACGYYPDESHDKVRKLVRDGYAHLKLHGPTIAALDFSDDRSDRFRDGGLYLQMFDMRGVCLANGDNQQLIGKSMYDVQDEDGRHYIREMVERARKGGGWVTAKLRSAFQSIYAERVTLGQDDYVVACGFYPASKHDRMKLLAKSAASYLDNNTTERAFAEFVKRDGRFIRGSLRVFAFDSNGVCHAYGDRHNLIWRNLFEVTDDDGKLFVKELIERARGGADTVRYRLNGEPVLAYVEPVIKDGVEYVVGSSYYE